MIKVLDRFDEKDIPAVYKEIVYFIETYFRKANMKTAVIGISGGKDSTVTAKLLVDALGKENVYGVLMPNGVQSDIEDSRKVVELLGIRWTEVNIKDMYDDFIWNVPYDSKQMRINLAPRIRMTTLYAVAQGLGSALVINTCNFCEDVVGYSSRYGDSAGDISPLKYLTVSEIVALGDYLELPYELVHKTPSDGLCGKSDEDNLGVSYADIEKYIFSEDLGLNELVIIDDKYHKNLFKENHLPAPFSNRVYLLEEE
jgi:NAD+ synthase